MTALIHRVLFATDFSDCAMKAEAYAACISEAYHAPVEIFHVLELYPGLDPEYPINQVYVDQLRRETDAQLAEAERRFQDKRLNATVRYVLGVPSVQICAAAAESHADLIVLGTRGKTGLEHLLLGSTAERVVIKAPCPVLTVCLSGSRTGGEAVAVPAAGFRHILAPVDFSDYSLNALEYAVQVAKQLKATVTILHILEPVSYGLDLTLIHTSERERTRAHIEAELDRLVQAITLEGLTVHRAIRGGTPADSLLHFIGENRCDLVVMGTHGRRGLSHLVNGSVAEAVLRRAACPVLTVKSPKFASGHRRIVSKAPAEDVSAPHRDS
jgi:nucleotide-binding universal stress UspA family protein